MDAAWTWELSGYCARYGFWVNPQGMIIREADWDTTISNIYAKQVIWYLLECTNDKLPKETMFAFAEI